MRQGRAGSVALRPSGQTVAHKPAHTSTRCCARQREGGAWRGVERGVERRGTAGVGGGGGLARERAA
jgi:hypothetical protein